MYEGRIQSLRVSKLLPSSLCKIPICNNPFQSNNINKFVVYSFLFYSTSSSNILCIVSCLHSQPIPIIFLHPLSICVFPYLLVHEQCTRPKKIAKHTHCHNNFKTRFHGHYSQFKNYFVTVFLAINLQFSVISGIKTDPKLQYYQTYIVSIFCFIDTILNIKNVMLTSNKQSYGSPNSGGPIFLY